MPSRFWTLVLISSCLLLSPGRGQELSPKELAFQRQMTRCRMVGSYTVGAGSTPKKEIYSVETVEKLESGKWRFLARIQYGNKDVKIPVPVDVRWAGDTPMIQVTDLGLPFLGKYSARVLVHGDQYAGTWSGKGYGGHLFGRIDRLRDVGEAVEVEEETEEIAPEEEMVEDPIIKDAVIRDAVISDRPVTSPGDQERIASWMNWRGPTHSGSAPKGSKPPVSFGEDKNLLWKVAIPGKGSSSPVVLGDRIFITSAIETDEDGEPAVKPVERGGRRGRRRGRRGRGGETQNKVHEFAVLCYDRNSGKQLWSRVVKEEVPHEQIHRTNTQASASCVTDGQHVYAFFGSRGLHCLDLDGKVKWSKFFGHMRTRNQFGEGASPAVYGDKLVMVWDHEGDSFITCLDKTTGKELWRTARDEVTTWVTPLVVPVGKSHQVIVTGRTASRGYDLETGAVIWSLGGMTTNCIPSPIVEDGICYLMSGFRGAALQAVDLGKAKGELTSESDAVLWEYGQNTSYVPSACLYQGKLYFLRTNTGRLSCVDAKTGEAHYSGESTGVRSVYASPVAANGHLYVCSREGLVSVIKAGPEFKQVATNDLGETLDATPAIIGDRMYLRGANHLFCVGSSD